MPGVNLGPPPASATSSLPRRPPVLLRTCSVPWRRWPAMELDFLGGARSTSRSEPAAGAPGGASTIGATWPQRSNLTGGYAACAPPWQSRYPTTCRYSSRVDRLDAALVAPGGGPQPQPSRGARRGHPHPLTNYVACGSSGPKGMLSSWKFRKIDHFSVNHLSSHSSA